MAKKKKAPPAPDPTLPSPLSRVILALLVPIALATFFSSFAARNLTDSRAMIAPFLGMLGASSWFLGIRWYGLPGMALRGGRPLFASIGFASLGWLALFLARLYFVDSVGIGSTGAGLMFFHLIVFEAFCVQLFAFGPFFRNVADWRGPLTAALAGGVLFAFIGLFYFGEPHELTGAAAFYFVAWGILYGFIRLRTGSILGSVIIQAVQGFTTWFVLLPPATLDLYWLNWMHGVVGVIFIVITWRLWPKTEEDYRV